MAARKKRKRTTAGGTRESARREAVPQPAGAGERLVVQFDEETGVDLPWREGPIEIKLNEPTECEGLFRRADGLQVPVKCLVEAFRLRIAMPPRPVEGRVARGSARPGTKQRGGR